VASRTWEDVKYRRGLQDNGLDPDKEQAWDNLFGALLEYQKTGRRLHVARREATFLPFPDYPESE